MPDSPQCVFAAVDGPPSRKGRFLLSKTKDELIEGGVLSVADNHRANVLFDVGFVVEVRSVEGFFMFLDFVLVVILETNLGEDSEGGVIEVVLSVDVEKGLSLRCESSAGDHLCGIEGLAHGYLFEVFDIGVEDEFVVVGREDGSAEVLDLDHGRLLRLCPGFSLVENMTYC